MYCDVNFDYRASYSLYRDGFYDIAERSFTEFLEKYPDSIYRERALYFVSLSMMKQNNLKGSIQSLTELAKNPSFEYRDAVVYNLTLNYHVAGDYNKSLEYYTIAQSLNLLSEWQENILFIAIKNYIFLKNEQKAIELADQYIAMQQYEIHKIDILKFMSDYYLAGKNYQKAIIHIDLMITEKNLLLSDRAVLSHNYLYSLFMLGRDKDAVSFFERNEPEYSSELYGIMADCYYRLGNKEKSFLLLDTQFTNTKDSKIAYKQSVILAEAKSYDKALELLESRSNSGDYILEKAQYARLVPDVPKGLKILKRKKITDYSRDEILLYTDIVNFLNDTQSYKNIADNITMCDSLLNTERNSILYTTAVALYNAGEYKSSSVVMNRWIKEFTDDHLYDRVLFMNGVAQKNLKQYQNAISEFSKVQRIKKEDKIYYESFVEKAECFFSLKEYGQAIRMYELYLANKVTDVRKNECMLQLGNAHYNIKKYTNAYKVYDNYQKLYGNKNNIYVKIADTLLKSANYKEAQKYFAKQSNIGDYPFFVYLFSTFKNEEFEIVFSNKENIYSYEKTEYFKEMLYLIVLSGQKIKKNEELIPIFEKNKQLIVNEPSGKIRRALLNSFLKIRRDDLAVSLFEKPDSTMYYFLGELFSDFLYPEIAVKWFDKVINNKITLEYREVLKVFKFYIETNNYGMAEKTAEFMSILFPVSFEPLLYKYIIYINTGNFAELKKLSAHSRIKENKTFETLVNLSLEYSTEMNKEKYLNHLSSLLDDADVDNAVIKQVIRQILSLSIDIGDYKKAIVVLNKIPSAKMNLIDADIRILEAMIYEKTGNSEKAIDLYLKIYYIYPTDISVVYASILRVITIYKVINDIQRITKIKEMFEDKYFIIEGKI